MQLNTSTRLMVRGNQYVANDPLNNGGGATRHPSNSRGLEQRSTQGFATLTQVMRSTVVNEVRGGYSTFTYHNGPSFEATVPVVNLRGYTIGRNGDAFVIDHTLQVRDDLSVVLTGGGRHELKLGGEAIYSFVDYPNFESAGANPFGALDATGGPVPRNIENLFPVWDDPSTWNLRALSPITVNYSQGIGKFSQRNGRKVGAAWIQDDWTLPRLTLNLGLRYDVAVGELAEHITLPPFLPATRDSELLNFQPRVGFAYTLTDKTVIRGGGGKHFGQVTDVPTLSLNLNKQAVTVLIQNDGRPDFAVNPFNGPPPTFEAALQQARGRSLTAVLGVISEDFRSAYTWQGSLGLQRQVGETLAIDADYVYTAGRGEESSWNENLSYDPATGANYPVRDVSKRPFPEWAVIRRLNSNGRSHSHALQTAFTKRFSHRWQASATYTLSGSWNTEGGPTGPCFVSGAIGPCPAGFQVAPDLGWEYTLAAGDQRHRAVFNGIWQLPFDFQLSGLYFFGSGQRYATSYGADLRQVGFGIGATAFPARLRPDGTIMPRNSFVGTPLHRVDVRIQRQFALPGNVKIGGIFEAFNLFNHVNHGSFVTTETSALYGRPQQNTNVAYQPRMLQLGFRVTF